MIAGDVRPGQDLVDEGAHRLKGGLMVEVAAWSKGTLLTTPDGT